MERTAGPDASDTLAHARDAAAPSRDDEADRLIARAREPEELAYQRIREVT